MKIVKSTLGKIALEIKTGKTPPTSNSEYFGDEINWYTPTDLDREKILGNSKRRITQKALIDKKVVVLKPNTVLLGCIGDIGKIGLIKKSASSNQQITGILPKQEIVNSEFLYYWLKSNKNRLKDTSTSAIVPILNNKQLSTIKIEYPENIDDQIRIAEILTQAENLIIQRKESIVLLDELLKSTFLEMFGDNTYPINTIEDISLNIVDCPHSTPKYQDSISDYPCIRTSEIKNGKIDWFSMKYTDYEGYLQRVERLVPQAGDIIFAREGSVGDAAIIPQNITLSLGQRVMMFRINPDFAMPEYIWALIKSDKTQQIIKSKSIGATVSRINISEVRKIPCPIPPINLQIQFATVVEKVEALKSEYQTSLKELENMYGVLSQKAFKGDLDLSKIAISEVIINSKTFLEKPIEEVNNNNSEYFKINIEQKIDEIIKNYKNEKLFSIDMIHRELDQYKIQFNVTQAKVYIKQLMEKDIIIQEYSGDTKQVMFKLKK